MSKEVSDLIATKTSNTGIWMVRASHGLKLSAFRANRVAAIAHADKLDTRTIKTICSGDADVEQIRKALQSVLEKQYDPKRAKFRATNYAHQIIRFCREISDGDYVVSVDSGTMVLGRVVGQSYFDDSPLKVFDPNKPEGESDSTDFNIRRRIEWLTSEKRSDLPYRTRSALYGQQTVYSLSRYWEDIFGLLFPLYLGGHSLYLSAWARRAERISGMSVGRYALALAVADRLSEHFSDVDPAAVDLDALRQYLQALDTDSLQEAGFALQAELYSPGPIRAIFENANGNRLAWLIVVLGFVIGADVNIGYGLIEIETDGLLTTDMKEKLIQSVLPEVKAKMDDVGVESAEKELRVTYPKMHSPK